MKKYVKPELFFEQFELSTHIADCALDYVDSSGTKTYTDADICIAYTDKDFWGSEKPVFSSNNGSCATKFDSYCYTTGTGGNKTFVS